MMKDQLGRETKVGDVVAYSSMNTTGCYTGLVLKIGENQIKTNGGNKASGNFIVITDQMIANGQEDKVDALRRQYAADMDFSVAKPKKASAKWRYALARTGQFITIGKLACNNQIEQSQSFHAFMKGKDEGLERYSSWKGQRYVDSFHSVPRPNSYGDSAFFKLADIKDLGLTQFIEQEITLEAFQAALDSSTSEMAKTVKASGVWKL